MHAWIRKKMWFCKSREENCVWHLITSITTCPTWSLRLKTRLLQQSNTIHEQLLFPVRTQRYFSVISSRGAQVFQTNMHVFVKWSQYLIGKEESFFSPKTKSIAKRLCGLNYEQNGSMYYSCKIIENLAPIALSLMTWRLFSCEERCFQDSFENLWPHPRNFQKSCRASVVAHTSVSQQRSTSPKNQHYQKSTMQRKPSFLEWRKTWVFAALERKHA